MVEAVRRARAAGIRTGHDLQLLGSGRYDRALLDELFDGTVISGEVRMRKPAPEIYASAPSASGCPPEACVFVDDLGFNLKPAAAMGMATVRHRRPEETIAELEAAAVRRAAMRRPALGVLIALSVGAVLMLAGCGGIGLTAAQVRSRATQACDRAADRSAGIRLPEAPSGGQRFLAQGIAVLAPEIQALRSLGDHGPIHVAVAAMQGELARCAPR